MSVDAEIVVLGLDPGSRATGFGVVGEKSGQVRLIETGVIRTPVKKDMATRLGVIFKELSAIIARHSPSEAAIESVFVAKNPASALKLGQARGAAMSACAVAEVEMSEYTPSQIKQQLVGTGRAAKEQVAFMAAQILGVNSPNWANDASDALAVAICHLNNRRFNKLANL